MNEIRDARSLRDIQKLGVVIETLPPELRLRVLYQWRLRTQFHDRLSQAGIEVLPEQDAINNGLPYLYVNINILNTSVGLYVFATRLCLKQSMLLPRKPSVELYTSTWEIGGVGTVGVNNLSAMLGSVQQHLDQFCQDHLAENLDFYRVSEWLERLADRLGRLNHEPQHGLFAGQPASNG